MAEGPLELAADTPRPGDGVRFDIFTDPQDRNRGTMVLNDLTGRYRVSATDYTEIDGARVLRVWYEPAPNA
jgi:hypothetical protein